MLGAAVSAVILIIASATAVYQHNEKEGNLWVDVYTERYTDFEAFKSFMETEEKVYFDVCSDEPCFVYDPNDNLIQFEWNNGRVIEYELYDEEDEELCIFATCLPEGSTVYWNRITEFLFQARFFIYPVLMILGLASFEIGMICILKKSRNQNGDI